MLAVAYSTAVQTVAAHHGAVIAVAASRLAGSIAARRHLHQTASGHLLRGASFTTGRPVLSTRRATAIAAVIPSQVACVRGLTTRSSLASDIFGWSRLRHQQQLSVTQQTQIQQQLEPQLVALFSSLAQHDQPQKRDEAGQSSNSSSTQPPAGSGGGAGLDHEAPLPASYRRHALEISHEILRSLNPHAQMTTTDRVRNLVVALLCCFALGGVVVFTFSDHLKTAVSEQTADVAKRSLGSEELQTQVNALSMEVVRSLLKDEVIMTNGLAFLQTLFAAPETKASLITLLQATIKDPATLTMLSALASDLVRDLLQKPETVDQLTRLLRQAITEPGNEQALQVLLKNFANDAKTQEMIAAKKAAMDVLNDAMVKETAIVFIRSTLADSSVQQSSGEALWGAVKAAVRPSWLHAKPTHTLDQVPITEITVVQVVPSIAVAPVQQAEQPTDENPNPEGVPAPAEVAVELPLPTATASTAASTTDAKLP